MGYNVQVAVETKHHLIITHEVTNAGTDRSQLTSVAKKAKATLKVENLDAVADRGTSIVKRFWHAKRQVLRSRRRSR